MKKLISILLAFALFVGVMPAYAGEADAEMTNLLTDGGFEAIDSISEKWNFSDSGVWYRGGTADVDTNTVHNGGSTKSVTSTDAIVGQKVALEKDKTYRFEIWINVTKAAYIDAGFFTANSAGAITIVKTPDNKKLESVNEWEKVTVDYTPTTSGSYVVGVYNQSKKYTEDGTFLTSKPSSGWPAGTQIYIDDAALYEIKPEESASPEPEESTSPEPEESTEPDVTPFPEDERNLLSDGTFENIDALEATNWNYPNKGRWYGNGDAVLKNDGQAKSGTKSLYMTDAIAGQKVSLEADKKYHFEIWVYATAAGYFDAGLFDTSSNPVYVAEDKHITVTNEWQKLEFDWICTDSKDYVAGVYNRSKRYDADGNFNSSNSNTKIPIYIDDALLYEVQREETETQRVKVINKTVSDGKITYNVVVPSGTQGYITAASYNNSDNDEPIDTVTMRSSTMPQPLEISIGTAQNGRTEFNLYDSTDSNKKLISLPSTDEWTTDKPSSSITFTLNDDDGRSTALDSVNTYPLYVGDTETDDFSKWSESGHGIERGSNIRLKATVKSDDYTTDDITWTVSDSTIVRLNTNNKSAPSVQGIRTGTAIVTATLPDGASQSCYFTVLDNYNRLQVQRIELNADRLTLAVNAQATLKPILYPKDYLDDNMIDQTLIWSTSDKNVATVDNGIITAVGKGTAAITATSEDVGRTAVCTVTVTDSIDTTEITKTQTETTQMTVGETAQLRANAGDSRIIWKSENAYIADVDENGTVTAYANSRKQTVGDKVINDITYKGLDVNEVPGTVKIYATAENGGFTAEYDIQVDDAPVTAYEVSINRDSISIPNGQTANITAVVSPSRIVGDDKNITWESDNTGVVTVSESTDNIFGAAQTTLTAVGTGTATVTAKRGKLTDTCKVIVTDGEVKVSAEDIELSDKTIVTDEVYQFTPRANNENVTNNKLFWVSTDETVATIDNEGNIWGYRPGRMTVYAIAMDSLTEEQIETLENLKYSTKTIGADNETLKSVLDNDGTVYKSCTVTVTNPSEYIRNLHIANETITSDSINLLWNRSSLIDAADLDHYEVYKNNVKIADTKMLGYTAEGLSPETSYTFKVIAVDNDGTELGNAEISGTTEAAPTKIINVLEYGAKGNGLVNDTYAIQKAIDECPKNGEVWLPGDGHIYYTGALFLKDDMTFRVDGIILGSINPTDYPMHITLWEGWRKLPQGTEWANATFDNGGSDKNKTDRALPMNNYQHASLINAGVYDEGEDGYTGPYNVSNITICGDGEINGNGFSLATNEGPNYNVKHRKIMNPSLRGRTILMQNAQDVYIKDITTSFAPSWTNHIIFSNRFTFDGISIISMGNGDTGSGWSTPDKRGHIWNGDGIDPESCVNMNIFNLYLKTGDDAITLKSGRNKEGNDRDKPCAYIRMTDCHGYETLAGFGAGSEIASGAHDILMQNMSLNNSFDYLVWIKTMSVRGGVIENFKIRDMDATKVNSVVFLDGAYTNTNPSAVVNPSDEDAVVRRFLFENVNGGASCNYGYRIRGISSSNKIDDVVIRGGTMESGSSTFSNGSNFTLYNCEAQWDKTYPEITISDTDPRPSPEVFDPSESPEPSKSPEPSESPESSESPTPSETPEPSKSPKPSETPEPSDNPEPSESPEPMETVNISYANSIVTVNNLNLTDSGAAVLIAAEYEGATLKSVKIYDVTKDENTVDLSEDFRTGEGVTLMLWESIKNMKPIIYKKQTVIIGQ